MKFTFMFSFLFLNLLFQVAEARYFVIPVTAQLLDPAQRVHVVIAGRGNDLSTSLQMAATAKIARLRKIYPNDQLLFITTEEDSSNALALKEMGYKNIQLKENLLDLRTLMDELSGFQAIASFHVFSHSGVVAGLFLDRYPNGVDVRWLPQDPQVKRLAHHFTDDAFATLNGCNAGHVQAPLLSSIWEIPVAGALSSSHLETVYQDGRYYWTDQKNKTLMKPCHSRTCYRLRPDNIEYSGYWGIFKQGLPFFKFFCAFDNQEKCMHAMVASIESNVGLEILQPKASFEHFAAAVREWLCPSGRYPSQLQKNCIDTLAKLNLKNPNRSYSPFLGGSAQCSFKSCYEAPECMFPDKKLCPLEAPLHRATTTFVDEYIAYLKAYQWIHRK